MEVSARASVRQSDLHPIEGAVRHAAAGGPLLLAVSGGRDSMVLLHAAARAAADRVAAVATFDHGTGAFARRAVALVCDEAARLGFPVVAGRAASNGGTEAAWRDARHAFLGSAARSAGAQVATAHTRDDQAETVLMRVLRDAGARGLAGLYAATGIARPLLAFNRDEVADYADTVGARWMDDPSNASRRHLRNRVRHDLLPALTGMQPTLTDDLLRLSEDAAAVRRRLDRHAAAVAEVDARGHRLSIPASALASRAPEEIALLWPAFAALLGIAMDWRGTERAVAFTTLSRSGSRMPLSGGWELRRERDRYEVCRAVVPPMTAVSRIESGTRWEDWCFMATSAAPDTSDEWTAQLPPSEVLSVRGWLPGDRMRVGGRPRRVKRFLSDARISGARRAGWPVVLAGDEIVWIPGVRRSDAAAVRPGRPGVVYRCELHDR